MPSVQSAYHINHSMEMALAKVSSAIIIGVDRRDVLLLALLDLSAAFDAGNHDIILQYLCISQGINDLALDWFNSYLPDRHESGLFGRDVHRLPSSSWNTTGARALPAAVHTIHVRCSTGH